MVDNDISVGLLGYAIRLSGEKEKDTFLDAIRPHISISSRFLKKRNTFYICREINGSCVVDDDDTKAEIVVRSCDRGSISESERICIRLEDALKIVREMERGVISEEEFSSSFNDLLA